MRKPEYMQVNCARCHSEIYDIKDEAPVLYEGRYLFANLGCSNCHQMDSIPADQNRKVGTDLRHITAKLSPAYINTWIWAPKAFRPSTKMPHFFMLENNSSARRIPPHADRGAGDHRISRPDRHSSAAGASIPEGLKGSAEAGQKVFESIGCMGCHANLNDPSARSAPMACSRPAANHGSPPTSSNPANSNRTHQKPAKNPPPPNSPPKPASSTTP